MALGHNTMRGAAGAAVLNAELMHSEGLLDLMIVMKFGGTSVESAAAIERVAKIVKDRQDATPRGGGFRHGQDHQQAPGHRPNRSHGHPRSYLAQIHDLRDFHSREARHIVSLAERTALDRTLDDHFQELTELVKGLAVWVN